MRNKDEDLNPFVVNRETGHFAAVIREEESSHRRNKAVDTGNVTKPDSFYQQKLEFLDQEIESLRELQGKVRRKINTNRQLKS